MVNRIRIYPYRKGSNSVRVLKEELSCKVIKLEGSTFKPRPNDVIINWGNSSPMETREGVTFLNSPDKVSLVSNKLNYFKELNNEEYQECIPPFWENAEEIPDEAFPVFCRTSLTGNSGAGIVVADSRDDLVPCRLYVKYIKKQHEYRVHVAKGRDGVYYVIAIQQKARKLDVPDDQVNWKIRNLAGGFIFKREEVEPPESIITTAIKVVDKFDLDFGAVDMIWNEKQQRAYALEINTAPGLEGQTVQDYAEFFKNEYINNAL